MHRTQIENFVNKVTTQKQGSLFMEAFSSMKVAEFLTNPENASECNWHFFAELQ